jgi:hypothetical protein
MPNSRLDGILTFDWNFPKKFVFAAVWSFPQISAEECCFIALSDSGLDWTQGVCPARGEDWE